MPAERRTSFFRPATLQQPIWETIRHAAAARVEGSARHTPRAASPSPLGGPMCHHRCDPAAALTLLVCEGLVYTWSPGTMRYGPGGAETCLTQLTTL